MVRKMKTKQYTAMPFDHHSSVLERVGYHKFYPYSRDDRLDAVLEQLKATADKLEEMTEKLKELAGK